MTCHKRSGKESIGVLHSGETGSQEDVQAPGLESPMLGCNDDKHREVAMRLPAAEAAQRKIDAPLTHQCSDRSGDASMSLFCCPLTQACSNIQSGHYTSTVICLSFAAYTVDASLPEICHRQIRMVQVCWHFAFMSGIGFNGGKGCSPNLEANLVPE